MTKNKKAMHEKLTTFIKKGAFKGGKPAAKETKKEKDC